MRQTPIALCVSLITALTGHAIAGELTDCSASSNTSNGFALVGESFILDGSNSQDNAGDGWYLIADHFFILSSGATNNNGNGVTIENLTGDARSIENMTSNGNGGSGLLATSTTGGGGGAVTLTRCVTNANALNGVELATTTGGTIRRCESSNNGLVGFLVTGSGHTVIENNAASNAAGGYPVPLPGNSLGPIVGETGLATNTSPAANYVR